MVSIASINTKKQPGLSPLVHDYYYAFDKVAGFYNGDFRSLDAFRNLGAETHPAESHRKLLAGILREQNRAFGCGDRTLANIDRLEKAGTFAVVTGQQVGLFSGPLYTIYKALTAVKLAEFLERSGLGSFVPVFWLASDDHDLAEINHINLINSANSLEEIDYKSGRKDNRLPVGELLLKEDVHLSLDRLDVLTRESEFKAAVLEGLREDYRPGRSFSSAFASWMTRLINFTGLVFIDPGHKGLKSLGNKIFSMEIEEESPSTEMAVKTTDELARAGYHAQIPLHSGLLNLFFAEPERRSIRLQDGRYSITGTGRSFTKGEFLDILGKRPEAFSPNALLRPLFQDALLPTAAYVGGTAEAAYFAQLGGVYAHFGLPMPVFYPRKSVTVLEKRVDAVLEKYNLTVEDFWRHADEALRDLMRKNLPDSLKKAIGEAEAHLEGDFIPITQGMTALDPGLENVARSSLKKIRHQLGLLERKAIQSAEERELVMVRQFKKARESLFPAGRLQERVLNITPFLIKHGYSFVNRLYDEIDLSLFDHQIIHV